MKPLPSLAVLIRRAFIAVAAFTVHPFRKPFEIDDADARSVQKTPAGVLVVRRGLFFVKRQRRCAVYLQKKKKRLKKRIKEYRYKLESGEWDEAEYALHITPVLAHVVISRCRRHCNRILQR